MNDPDQTMALRGLGSDLRDRLAPYEDPTDFDERPAPAESTMGLVSFGFIWAALRRRLLLWASLAVVGLIIGCGSYVGMPPAHTATTGLFLVSDPTHNSTTEAATDIALAESLPVAAAVVKQLGLPETPSAFLANYTVTGTTSQVLTITARASSSDEAVRRAAAVAAQFLKFRAAYMLTQQQQTASQLQDQVKQAQQRVDSLSTQITQLQSSGGLASAISGLKAQRTDAQNALSQVQQYATTTMASSQTLTESMIRGSQVLNQAVPVKSSFTKGVLIYGIGGLVAGLMIGLAIVVIGAITSDRLLRRDDIAYAIGAPVRLSVGPLRKARWRLELPARSASRRRDMERVVEHLRNIVPASTRGPSGLAVVAVDDPQTAARAVAEFVMSNAKRRRIVVADLSAGTHAARLLGVDRPGISTISPSGSPIVVMVPAAEDIAPVGYIASRSARMHADEKITSACAHADLVLSLVTLDPAFGGDHIATWATDVAAVVTAGRSTATRVHAAGEMIRLAGARLASVVVVDTDASDESLGALNEEYQHATT